MSTRVWSHAEVRPAHCLAISEQQRWFCSNKTSEKNLAASFFFLADCRLTTCIPPPFVSDPVHPLGYSDMEGYRLQQQARASTILNDQFECHQC